MIYRGFVKGSVWVLLLNMLLTSLISSCSNENEELTLGSEFVERATDIIEVDTFYVELSTVLIDSIQTSNLGVVLSGYYEDSELGDIKATSFLTFSLPSTFDIENDDKYDSLTLVLPYSSYSFGDTNTIQQILIYRLSESLSLPSSSDKYYNTSDINKFDTPIGSYSFYPRPNRDTIVEIRLSNNLGLDITNKLKASALEVSSTVEFEKYFHGIAISSDEFQCNSIIGFDSENVKMRLYTSRIENEVEEIVNEFNHTSALYQFNQLSGDRTNTLLSNLLTQKVDLRSDLTDNKSYIQGGTGIITKVRFPYFNTRIFDENELILKVELILKPTQECYDTGFPDLIYYKTNAYNEYVALNVDESGNAEVAEFNMDELYKTETYYSFDITEFIKEELEDDYFDNSTGLFITLNSPDFNTTVDRMILSGNGNYKNRPVLKIKYLKN
ncbi:MAG TPA: hypothetical protein DCG75_11200 [Bacteroidales bacterium]|jgi:hypothetical protein|nr:hypothetical protein [Bacteroidales bacterium]